MTIKLNIDSMRYIEKPTQYYGVIRARLCNKDSIREIDPEELIKAVEQGRAFTPSVMTGKGGDTWQSQQVICADIDNDTGKKDAAGNKIRIDNPLTPDEAREIMSRYGIDPYFIYWSYSSRETFPRYRIVLILDAPLTDPAEAADLTARFIGLFNQERPGSTDTVNDNARMFLGSRPGSAVYRSGKLTPVSLLRKLPDPPEDPKKSAQKQREQTQQPKEYIYTPAPYNGVYRSQSVLDAMLQYDKEHFPLADYIEQTTGSQPHRIGNALFYNPCPLCGHNDCFQVTGSIYHDHGANGGTGGTIIDYLMNREQIDLPAAIDKFKFDIMKYSRDEWTEAWRAENPADQSGAHTVPAASSDGSAADGSQPEQYTRQNPDPLKGLLTADIMLTTLKKFDPRYFEMPHFKVLSETVKLKSNDTVVISGDTGGGKSSLALNFLYDLTTEYPALYFNLENNPAILLHRLIAICTNISIDRIQTCIQDPEDWDTRNEVKQALETLSARQPIQFVDEVYYLDEIEAQIRATTNGRTKPTLVFIDHALLVKLKGKSLTGYERFTVISEELRRIARLYNVIMFLLLQQSRDGKDQPDNPHKQKRPANSSLKNSGSWETDATKILFIWKNQLTGSKEIIVTKNRDGDQGYIPINYEPCSQIYYEPADARLESLN